MKPARWKADSALAFVALVWGTTFVVVKGALTQISTAYFLTLRFTLASLCMLFIFLPAFQRMRGQELKAGLRSGAGAGCLLWLGYMLQTFGLKYTSAGNSGFLTGLYIVLVPILVAILYRRLPAKSELIGLALASSGMVLMTLPAGSARLHINVGDLLTLGCAVAFAFHLLMLSRASKQHRFEAVALGQIACAAVLSGVSLSVEHPLALWSWGVVWAIILTAVFATAIAFALQTWGQKYTTPTRTAVIFALEPVFALVTAVAFGEPLRVAAVVGGGLILAGILAVELKPRGAAGALGSILST